jgi:RNA polymerase sigma-70 factor (ECF subfamily)
MTAATTTRDEAQTIEMIAAILAGDTRLFHQLIRPHERSVYMMALSLLHNEADAEDAAQEAFLKAYRNLASFRGDSKFGTWLISITLNEARSRLRRKSNIKTQSLDEPPDEEGHLSPALLRDWREIPSEALERQELRDVLRQAVTALPDIYREVFVLRDMEELNIAETAETLGISTASVKVRLHRARIMLQRALAPQLKLTNSTRRWFKWF